MGWRYRKSVTLFPGVKVNFGMKSASLSLGGKGFRTTYSTTGRVTRSFGIPGTGLSYVTTTNRKRSANNGTARIRDEYTMPVYTQPTTQSQTSIAHINQYEPDYRAETKETIEGIYEVADASINWREILIRDTNPGIQHWEYLKARAEKVLNGDLDTYFEIISDLNPVDDLLSFGSGFECGTEDPRVLSVRFSVNSGHVLKNIRHLPSVEYNELLQDYVCGCAIRVARDLFALLPFRRVIIDAENNGIDILSVEFTREGMTNVDYSLIDASDFVSRFNHRMSFTSYSGFERIDPLEAQ